MTTLGADLAARRPHTEVFELFRPDFRLEQETRGKAAAGLAWGDPPGMTRSYINSIPADLGQTVAWWAHVQVWFADPGHRPSGRIGFVKATQRFDVHAATRLLCTASRTCQSCWRRRRR